MFPPLSPRPELLAALRDGLVAVDYSETAIAARIGVETLHEIALGNPLPGNAEPGDALGVTIKLLLECQSVPRQLAAGTLPSSLLAALEGLEIVTPASDGRESLSSEVVLYPVDGLYIASDRPLDPRLQREDAVYPAVGWSSHMYLSALPCTPCDDVLEVCAGAAAAAILAARTARHVSAVDISERSTAFARFNAALNRVPELDVLEGDLFRPVEGRRFDRIFAHPPYVPALQQRVLYRDGGVDGEAVTRRILAEGPPLLKPGGRLYCWGMASERTDASLERRVRDLIGAAADEYDVLVVWSAEWNPMQHFAEELASGRIDYAGFERFVRSFKEIGVTRMLGAMIVIERHAWPRPPLTLRRRRVGGVAAPVDAVLRWEAFDSLTPDLARLAATRPRLAPQARLVVSHAQASGSWALAGCRIVLEGPLSAEMELTPQAASFLAACDGHRSVLEHMQRLVQDGSAPAGITIAEFGPAVLTLLKKGILEAELPEPA